MGCFRGPVVIDVRWCASLAASQKAAEAADAARAAAEVLTPPAPATPLLNADGSHQVGCPCATCDIPF